MAWRLITRTTPRKLRVRFTDFTARTTSAWTRQFRKREELMKAAGKKYEPVIYKGAGHGFMREGEPNNPDKRDGEQESARRSLGALEDVAEAAVGKVWRFVSRRYPKSLGSGD